MDSRYPNLFGFFFSFVLLIDLCKSDGSMAF